MSEEFELVSHNESNYHLFLVRMLSRTPHIHMDYEVLLVLSGSIHVVMAGKKDYFLKKDQIFIVNPMAVHSFETDSPALLLLLQISPSFFAASAPELCHTEFQCPDEGIPKNDSLRTILLELSEQYFKKDNWYALKCASLLYDLFYRFLQHIPNRQISEQSYSSGQIRGARIRRILDYIGAHYAERITLKQIAAGEGLSFYYVSHLFRECMGMSFQEYLARIRCGHARVLLRNTSLSLLEICMECGFSDPKYFNREYGRIYGLLPKEDRSAGKVSEKLFAGSGGMSSQVILSDAEALKAVKTFVH